MAKDPSSSSSASLTNLYTHLQALIKKWVYDKPEVDNKLSNKLDKAQTSYKGKNVIVDSSSGNITFEDKNNHTHSQYLTEHQDISGKEDNSNKVTSLDSFSTDTEYPSAKAVYDEIWTDLYGTILNDYVPNNSLGSVAFSNDYDDLDNKPTIPTATSDLTNDSFGEMAYHSYLSEIAGSTDIIDILQADGYSLFSGDYDDLDNKPTIPTIPTNVSAFNNDSGYLTAHQDITGKEDKSNKVTSLSSSSTDTQYPSAKAVYDAIENTFNLDTLDCINENFNMLSLPHMTLIFDGDDFTNGRGSLIYHDDIYIDWGDETSIEAYTEEDPVDTFSHSYEDGLDTHTIRIYGNILNIGGQCFRECHGLRCVTLPETVKQISSRAFYGCTDLIHINIPKTVISILTGSFAGCTNSNFTMFLNWTETDILTFTYSWTTSDIIVPTFSIPYGTTSLYESKGYPTEKLVERSE